MADPWAGFTDAGTSPAAPAAVQADPWAGFKDAGPNAEPAAAAGDEGDFLHPKKPTGTGWKAVGERLLQYPGIALGQITDAGKTLGKVARGEIDAASPEAVGAATDLGLNVVGGPLGGRSVAAGTGAQIARRAGLGKVQPGEATPGFRPPTPNIEAAQTAAGLEGELPAGLISNTPGVQAVTQAARQLPFVGQMIDERVGGAVKAAGGKVNEIATDLAGGNVPDRATAGARLRPSLQSVVDDNKLRIDQTYTSLRRIIEPDKVTPLPRTKAALQAILQERGIAGKVKPESGLQDYINLADQGTSFNGLVRARNEVGEIIGRDADPHRGFIPADFRRLYGAMSADMDGLVRRNAKFDPDKASDFLRFANNKAQTYIDRNKNLQTLLHPSMSNESMVGSVINSAREKSGNARMLAQLRQQMPKDDFEQVVGVGLSELGHNTATGKFSLAQFSREWGKLGNTAKSVLINDPTHRKALDDIANMGLFLKDADKYVNTSNTGRAGLLGGLIGAGATAVASMDPLKVLGVILGAGGGYTAARVLARPATASALRKWATIAADKNTGRWSAGKRALWGIATRNLLNNLRDLPGISGDESTTQAAAPIKPAPLPRAAPPRKIQDRAPAAP